MGLTAERLSNLTPAAGERHNEASMAPSTANHGRGAHCLWRMNSGGAGSHFVRTLQPAQSSGSRCPHGPSSALTWSSAGARKPEQDQEAAASVPARPITYL